MGLTRPNKPKAYQESMAMIWGADPSDGLWASVAVDSSGYLYQKGYVKDPSTLEWVPATQGILATDVLTANPSNYAVKVDVSADPVLYVGEAAIGSATSSAVWRVKKVDTTTGVSITWAGSGSFNQIWDNRASLTYT